MRFEKTLYITESEHNIINKYLTREPEGPSECLGEDCSISNVVHFDNGFEMSIMLCGVQYKEGDSNLAWTQAVLYKDGIELAYTDPEGEYLGEWICYYRGNEYVAYVEVRSDPLDRKNKDEVTSHLIEKVRTLRDSTPSGMIKDADTILADIMSEVDFEEPGFSEALFNIWQHSYDKRCVESIFFLFTDTTLQSFLERCVNETACPQDDSLPESQQMKLFDNTPRVKITGGRVEIYTDGSCLQNPGPGGWAAVIIKDGEEREISGGEKLTTNNRMELLAVINALRSIPDGCDVTVMSDSQYITNAFNEGWVTKWEKQNWMRNKKDPVVNPDLWKDLVALTKKHKVKFVWIKGHAGHPYNERCDKLAVKEAKRYQY